MNLTQPLLKLPIQFSADRLTAEVRALPQQAWIPHPQGFVGNEAVPLITPNGELTNDIGGSMAPTEHLLACPYMMQVMSELGAVWGRGRLMALAPGAEVPGHVDFNYYWRTHYRVHIPVVTNTDVTFTCGDQEVHMAAGECWIPDTFRRHAVRNGGNEQRIHLVLDTVGGERFWRLVDAAQSGADVSGVESRSAATVPEIVFEQFNAPAIMSPYELHYHVAYLVDHLVSDPRIPALKRRLDQFVASWSAAWARFGASEAGVAVYRELIARVRSDLEQSGGEPILLDNGKTFFLFFEKFVLINAVSRQLAERVEAGRSPTFRRAAAR